MVDAIKRSRMLQFILVSTLVALLLVRWLNAPGVPVRVISGEIWPSAVQQGGELHVKFIVDRNQSCPNSIDSYWTTANDQRLAVVRMPTRTRTIPTLGRNLPVYLDLAAPYWIGDICYRSAVYHRCPDGQYTVETPPLCVTVTP